MADGSSLQEIDISTFEPLTAIKSLQIGPMEEEKVLELCTILMSIDVIQFPEFKISCFEYVNGYTFEQSMVSNTPHPDLEEPELPLPSGDDNTIDKTSHIESGKIKDARVDEAVDASHVRNSTEPKTLIPTTTPESLGADPTEASNIEKQTSSVNPELMNNILLGEWVNSSVY